MTTRLLRKLTTLGLLTFSHHAIAHSTDGSFVVDGRSVVTRAVLDGEVMGEAIIVQEGTAEKIFNEMEVNPESGENVCTVDDNVKTVEVITKSGPSFVCERWPAKSCGWGEDEFYYKCTIEVDLKSGSVK